MTRAAAFLLGILGMACSTSESREKPKRSAADVLAQVEQAIVGGGMKARHEDSGGKFRTLTAVAETQAQCDAVRAAVFKISDAPDCLIIQCRRKDGDAYVGVFALVSYEGAWHEGSESYPRCAR